MGGMNVSDRNLMDAPIEWPPPPETAQAAAKVVRARVDDDAAAEVLEMLGIAGLV